MLRSPDHRLSSTNQVSRLGEFISATLVGNHSWERNSVVISGTKVLDREEHSMDQYRSRLKLSENFERHSYGPIIGPYLFLGKFV